MARSMALFKFRDTISKVVFSKFSFSPQVTKFRLNSTFKAACLKEYGKPLEIHQFTRVPLDRGQVRVGVNYCSLNINDIKYLEQSNEGEKELPFVPGYELSGEILEVGEGCNSDVSVGQRVVGVIHSGNGGLATEAVVRASNVWELHPEIPSPEAAAVVCGHSTALLAFSQFAQLNEGDIILIIAGAGGYGLAAVEVAATIFKAKVIAVGDTDGKASLLRDRGAFAAFKNDSKHNFKEIMKATKDKGVSLIYDAVGGPILNTVFDCLKDPANGIVLGTYRLRNMEKATPDEQSEDEEEDKDKEGKDKNEATKPAVLSQEVRDKYKTVNIFNYRDENQEEYYNLVSQTLQYYEEELITAHISKTFELEDINKAISYIKGKVCTGKVLIKIKDD